MIVRHGADDNALTRTIGAIYAAAVGPDHWVPALEQMRLLFTVGSAAFVVHNADRSKVDGVAAGVDPEGHRHQLQTIFRNNVLYDKTDRWYSGRIVHSAALTPNKIFHRTRMYQEYWRPRGLYDGLRLTISVDGAGIHHAINLLRAKSESLFAEQDFALGRMVMPHLQRAVELRRHLRRVDMLASVALNALDVVRHPVLLLDQNACVLHANAAAESLLHDADGLAASRGTLFAATPVLTAHLHAALARAAGHGGVPAKASTLRLPKRAGGAPLALLIMPFRHETHWSLAQRPAILLCVTDPAAAATLPGRQLTDLFGLTGAEASLATDLMAGEELREIAQRRNRSVNTVRTQLSRLMAKVDVNRQSELMRLLASLPRLRDPL